MSQDLIQSRIDYRDFKEVLRELKRIYSKRNVIEYTLLGEPIFSPYPVFKFGGRVIRGYRLTPDRLKYLDPIPHSKRVLALDASLKVLFNCGAFKIIVSKIAWGIWRGFQCERTGVLPVKIKIIWDKREASEWLLRIELEAALKLLSQMRFGDYLLMDRGLAISPILGRYVKNLFNRLDVFSSAKGVVLIGITKSSQLKLNTGESLLGYLTYLARQRMKDCAWFYHPIFKSSTLPSWFIGDMVVARLSDDDENVFRIDVSRRVLNRLPLDNIMGELAFMQDPATPGYPYPLKSVHDASRFTEEELERLANIFLEILEEKGLSPNFTADVRSTSFKERYLWGITL